MKRATLLVAMGLLGGVPSAASAQGIHWLDKPRCGELGRADFSDGPTSWAVEPTVGAMYDSDGAWRPRYGVNVLVYVPCSVPVVFGGGLAVDHAATGGQVGLATKAVVSYHWFADLRRGSWSVLAPRFEMGARLPLSTDQKATPSLDVFAGFELVRVAGIGGLWAGAQLRTPDGTENAPDGRPLLGVAMGISVTFGPGGGDVRAARATARAARGVTPAGPTGSGVRGGGGERLVPGTEDGLETNEPHFPGPFTARLVAAAVAEERAFRTPRRLLWCATCRNRKRRGQAAWARVASLWRDGIGSSTDWEGSYWSAAFVSAMVERADPPLSFQGHARHADYIRDAWVADKTEDQGYLFTLLDPSVASVVPGDIVCHGLGRAKDARFATLAADAERLGADRAGHCDIVIAVGSAEAVLIGGNLDHSVRTKVRKVGGDGRLSLDAGGAYKGDAEFGPAAVLRARKVRGESLASEPSEPGE